MAVQNGARTYRANSVLTASPGQLVLMLYDGALNSLALTREAFASPASDLGRFEAINRHLRKARNIISELQGTLNFEADQEFASLMHRLYDYYNRRLLEANMQKQVEPVIEIERLLGDVRDAWAEMMKQHRAPAARPGVAPGVLVA
jgi:flagellar protein FliS